MADDSQRPIIIRRKKVSGGASHGGAWKIAYADFVTAMMAFFLLMWLLGSTTKADLQGIAEYFKNPLKIALEGGSGSGDATSIIKGGGADLTRQQGQVRKGEPPSPVKKEFDAEEARRRLGQEEAQRLRDLKARLEAMIESSPSLKQFKRQLLLDITSEGLRIQIVDEQNRPMFASGRAQVQPYTREILREIAGVLNDVENRIGLSGHTDSTPYAGGEKGYSNWELSADRANASRRELTAGGLAEGKVLRVVGLASSVPFDKGDPASAANRRISIVVLNKKAEEAITSEGIDNTLDVDAKNALDPQQLAAPPAAPTPAAAAPKP
ncbi:MAG TPA: flagellar motor protein MotB [Burkholderiales bacterium]|nr:flagellar motor protein MotB [Burkholderiales bacterium]